MQLYSFFLFVCLKRKVAIHTQLHSLKACILYSNFSTLQEATLGCNVHGRVFIFYLFFCHEADVNGTYLAPCDDGIPPILSK